MSNSKGNSHIGGVMLSVLGLNAVDCEFEPQSCQTKECKSSICWWNEEILMCWNLENNYGYVHVFIKKNFGKQSE